MSCKTYIKAERASATAVIGNWDAHAWPIYCGVTVQRIGECAARTWDLRRLPVFFTGADSSVAGRFRLNKSAASWYRRSSFCFARVAKPKKPATIRESKCWSLRRMTRSLRRIFRTFSELDTTSR
jgi:hypothetical protein